TFDPVASAQLQDGATKKIEPQWPEELKKSGLSGKVQVRVQLNDKGKVTQANIFNSTLPEANLEVIAAARQWEFPTSALTGKSLPATATLTFEMSASPQKVEATPVKSVTNTNP
ncbi:MAG TPA: TonB family protein, partial [Blastocatellia bacterium]|nr:TonB family protein [Blastocatellia bacterium]